MGTIHLKKSPQKQQTNPSSKESPKFHPKTPKICEKISYGGGEKWWIRNPSLSRWQSAVEVGSLSHEI